MSPGGTVSVCALWDCGHEHWSLHPEQCPTPVPQGRAGVSCWGTHPSAAGCKTVPTRFHLFSPSLVLPPHWKCQVQASLFVFFFRGWKNQEWAVGVWEGGGGCFCSCWVEAEDGAESRYLRRPSRSSTSFPRANRAGLRRRTGREGEGKGSIHLHCAPSLRLVTPCNTQPLLMLLCSPLSPPETVPSSLVPGLCVNLGGPPHPGAALSLISSWIHLTLQLLFPSDPLNPLWKFGFCLHGQASSALLESFPGESTCSNIKQMSEGIGNFAHFWGKLGPGFYMSNVLGVQNSTCPRLWLFTGTIFLFSNDHFKSF